MTRETKRDRIARTLIEPLTEHLHQLKILQQNPDTKESDVERWADSFIRHCLGYSATAGYTVKSQETRGRSRPDLVLYQGERPICVVEIKKLGYDLNKTDFRSGKLQLSEYLHSVGNVKWGILCNGFQLRLFDFSVEPKGGIEVVSIDLRGDNDEIDLSRKFLSEMTWMVLDLHEVSYSDNTWDELSKESTVFSPESLFKAIVSPNAIKHIAREIRGEHEYRVNHEVLLDKVSRMLELGCNDAVPSWNEERQAEFHKIVSSSKRALRRKPRRESKKAMELVVDNSSSGSGESEDSGNGAAAA